MQSNRDTYRAAAVLIRQHGSEAKLQAAKRADELFDRGDMDGAALWSGIVVAVEVLQNMESPTGSRVH